MLRCCMISKKPHYLAYSGGLDSQVLLHLLCQWREADPSFTFQAIHINHGLSEQAAIWQAHCEASCVKWNVDLKVVSIDLSESNGHSLEALARQ